MMEDAGRGYRRVVPSPKPKSIVEIETIRTLTKDGVIVIAAGGGGIPVIRDAEGCLKGKEAVIDKDYAASLMARQLGADLFIISTAVPKVCLDYGKPTQRSVDEMNLKEAEEYTKQGQFAPGSMLLSTDFATAKKYSDQLQELNRQRQKLGEDTWQRLLPLADDSFTKSGSKIVVVEDPDISRGITGLMAGRLLKKYGVPSLVIAEVGERVSASIRSPEDFNCRDFLANFSDLFCDFGGHDGGRPSCRLSLHTGQAGGRDCGFEASAERGNRDSNGGCICCPADGRRG